MEASFKFATFTFDGETSQKAYLKGCKELAKYIAGKDSKNVTVKITRSIKPGDNSCKFELYTSIPIGEEQKNFCRICKEFHCSFYINEEYNCSRCNLKSFLKRVQEKGNTSKSYYKARLKSSTIKK